MIRVIALLSISVHVVLELAHARRTGVLWMEYGLVRRREDAGAFEAARVIHVLVGLASAGAALYYLPAALAGDDAGARTGLSKDDWAWLGLTVLMAIAIFVRLAPRPGKPIVHRRRPKRRKRLR